MAEEKAEQVDVENFVTDEEVQEHIDEGNEYVDEEPPAVVVREEEGEDETEEADSIQDDGGEGGGAIQPEDAPPPPDLSQWREDHFEWGRHLNLSRDEVVNFAGGARAFERMIGSVSNMSRSQEEYYRPTDNPFGVDLGEDHDDEGLAKVNEHYAGVTEQMMSEIEQLKRVNVDLHRKERERLAKVSADEFDSICDTMDETMFGRGSYDDLGSDVQPNRKSLANAVSRLGHGYAARGETVPPMRQLVKEAYGATFGGTIENQAIRKVSEKSKKLGSQTTAKPTHKDPEPLSAEQKAVQAAYEWQKEKGWI